MVLPCVSSASEPKTDNISNRDIRRIACKAVVPSSASFALAWYEYGKMPAKQGKVAITRFMVRGLGRLRAGTVWIRWTPHPLIAA